MIVHPRKCFKPFHPVQFVNQIGKITKNSIFWHFRLHIYTYICILTGLQVLRFLCEPSFAMLCSFQVWMDFFSRKSDQKSCSWGRFFGKTYGEWYMEGLMIRSYQGKGSKMYFPIICKSINCKFFPQLCWDIHLEIKP